MRKFYTLKPMQFKENIWFLGKYDKNLISTRVFRSQKSENPHAFSNANYLVVLALQIPVENIHKQAIQAEQVKGGTIEEKQNNQMQPGVRHVTDTKAKADQSKNRYGKVRVKGSRTRDIAGH